MALVSRWFPQEQQGTALGVFGAGTIGAAATIFLAPFVMVAYGWPVVARSWAIVLAAMAVLFWLVAKDDPSLVERRMTGARAASLEEHSNRWRNMTWMHLAIRRMERRVAPQLGGTHLLPELEEAEGTAIPEL